MIQKKLVLKQNKIKLTWVLIAFTSLFILIAIRLYVLQINQASFFQNIAKKQYSTEIEIMPSRANVYDRYKKPLAINKEITSAFVLPQQITDPEKTSPFLKKHFIKTYNAIQKNPQLKFIWLKRNIKKEALNLIEENNIKDIHFLNEQKRFYPHKEISQVLGFTDIDNNGISGIETEFNKTLGGKAALLKIEKDGRNKRSYFSKTLISPGTQGEIVKLTIDRNLQFLAAEEVRKTVEKFEALSGNAIIMNPSNGEILSMVNYPFFDPNEPIENIESTKNGCISECYEFGSVIKIFSALAALEENVTTTDEVIDCQGKVAYINGFKIENWKNLEKLSFAEVIRYSSNVGIAKVAKRLGDKQFYHLNKLGFGKTTNLEFPGERSGFVAPPHKWSRPTPLVLSFGYEINATLIQLAKAFAIIANNGFDIEPTLIGKEQQTNKLYSDKSINEIKDILEESAYHQQIPGYKVMGKTGTARIAENGTYSKTKHIYSFGGIIEKDNYKRVIITFIKEPKKTHLWASQVSAPLFQAIAEKTILNDSLRST